MMIKEPTFGTERDSLFSRALFLNLYFFETNFFIILLKTMKLLHRRMHRVSRIWYLIKALFVITLCLKLEPFIFRNTLCVSNLI